MWRTHKQKVIMRTIAQPNSGLPKFSCPKNFSQIAFYLFIGTRRFACASSSLPVPLEIHESCSLECIIFRFEAYKPFKGIPGWWMAGAVSEIYNNNDGFLIYFACVRLCVRAARLCARLFQCDLRHFSHFMRCQEFRYGFWRDAPSSCILF